MSRPVSSRRRKGHRDEPGIPARLRSAKRARVARKPPSTAVKSKEAPHPKENAISILLIDDNRLFRTGLSALLKKQAGLRLLAAAERPEGLARLHSSHPPDIVLLDLGLGGRGSVEVSRGIRAAYPEARLIVMGLIPLESEVLAFVKEGVSGFLLKDASIDDFVAAIRAVAGGRRVFPVSLTDSLLSEIVTDAARKGNVNPADVKMTPREREIVDLIGDGLSNKAISKQLSIAIDTVKSHVHSILEKLAVRSRLDIVMRARTKLS